MPLKGVLVVGWFLVLGLSAGAASAQPSEAPSPQLKVLAGLISSDGRVRAQAAAEAGRDGSAIFIGPLRARLADPLPKVRAQAAWALGEIGVPGSSVDLLSTLRALNTASGDDDDAVAQAALTAFARYPFPEVRRRLMERVRDTGLPPLRRQWARQAIAQADADEASRRLVAYLELTTAEALRDPTEPVPAPLRWGAAAGSLLVAARDLLSPENSLHEAAVRRIASDPARAARFVFLVHALKEPAAVSRRVAAATLAEQADAASARALTSSLNDPDRQVRQAALQGVAVRADAVSAGLLAERLKYEGEAKLQQLTRDLLRTQPSVPTLLALQRLAGQQPEPVERVALDVVGTWSSTLASSVLVDFVARSPHPTVTSLAASMLSEHPDGQVVPPALKALVALCADGRPHSGIVRVLTGRQHPEIGPSLVGIMQRGEAGPGVLGLVQALPEEQVREGVLALVAHGDAKRSARRAALRVAAGYRGQDALLAAEAALGYDPAGDQAFALLQAQDPKALLPVRLRLLSDDAYRARHPELLISLRDTRDPSLPAPVAQAVAPRPDLATQAIVLLRQQPSEPAIEALALLAAAPAWREPDRALAVQAIADFAKQPAGEAGPKQQVEAALLPLAKSKTTPVRYAARNALHRLEPTTYPSWDPYGRIPLIVEGAALGAGFMIMATEIADADLSKAFVGGAGAVLGGATPFLLTLNEDVTLGDAGVFGTYSAWGTAAGAGLGMALDLNKRDRLWMTIAGESLGVGAGALALNLLDWGLDDVAFANLTAMQAGLLSGGISALILDSDARRNQTALGVGLMTSAASLVPLAIFTRSAHVEDDLGLMATAMSHGAWLGAFAPGVFFDDGLTGKRAALGAALGQSAGYLAGIAWAHNADLRAEDAGWSAFGGAIGASALGGLGLMLESSDSRLRFGLLEAGSAAGALALGLMGRDLEFRDNDRWLIALLGLGGAFMGSDLSVRLEEGRLGEPGLAGGILMGAGFGTAAGLVASQFVDVSDKTLLRTVLGGAVGAAAGTGLGRMLPGLDVHDRSKVSGALTAAGLALTLPWAENLDLSGETWAYGAASGVVLGGLMALTPYHYNDGAPPGSQVGSAVLFGSAMGTFAGVAVAQSLELNLKQTGLATLATVAATGFGGGLGLVIPDSSAKLSAGLAQGLGLATFATASGLLAGDIWKTSRKRRSGGRGDSFARASGLALHGALHGALIPLTWRADDEVVPGKEVAGGLMLGASAGVLLGLGARGLGAPRLQSHDVLETSLLTSAVYGLSTGIAMAAEDRRLGAALVHGLGIPAYAAAWYASPHTTYDAQTPWTLTMGTGAGAWMGAWMSQLVLSDPTALGTAGGAVAGASVGALAGAAWSQLQPDRQEGEVLLDGIFGAGFGSGLALVLHRDLRASAGLIQAGSAAGLGLGLALSPHSEFSRGDGSLVALSTMLGVWHGLSVPGIFGQPSARQRGGAAAMGASLGFTAGSIAAQWSDLEDAAVVEMGLVAVAANSLGGGLSLALPRMGLAGRTAIQQGVGVAGLIAGAWMAPRTRYVVDDASLIGLTGGFGALVGALAPDLVRDGNGGRVQNGSMLAGLSAGTLVGVALSQTHRLGLGDQMESLLWGSAGTAMGGGVALLLSDPSSRARAGLLAGGATAGFAAGVALSPRTQFTGADRGLLGLSTALGAWHGSWLSSLWGDDAGSSRAGGALLGMGAGWVAAAVAAPFVEASGDQILNGGLVWAAGTGLGAGLGLLLPEVGPEATAGLMQGLGAAGLATGIIFADRLKLQGGDYALVPAGALLGAGLGLTLPAFVSSGDGQGAPRGAGVLLGASAGLLASGAVAQFVDPSFDDVMEASLTSIFAQGLGFGLGLMVPNSSEKVRFALLDGFGAAGLAAGLWLAPHTHYKEGSAMTLALGAGLGAGLGMLTPGYWNGDGLNNVPTQQLAGGALLGATLGLVSAAVLNQAWDITPTTRNHAALGASLGGLTGGGFGLLFSKDDRVAAGLTQGLAGAGALALGATLKDFDYDKGDLALGGAYVGYLTWHAMGLTLLLDGSNRQAAGVAVGTVGLGALTGMYLAPYIDMTLSDTLMLLAGNVWGTWIGGWGGQLLEDALGQDLTGRRQAGLTLIATVLGSDIGLALTGMVVGEILDVPPTQFAYINLAGLSGMLLGMVGAGFAKGEPLKAGNVVGSLSGLVVGAIVTSFFDWSSSPSWDQILSKRRLNADPKLAKADLPKTQGGHGFGVEHWMPSAQVTPSPEGDPMYLFTVSGVFR